MLRLALVLALLGAAPLARAAVAAPDAPSVVLEWESAWTGSDFRLSAPRPNPFTSLTRFELSVDTATDLVVTVHDALGRRVALLHEGALRPGTYSLRIVAADLPPGLYIVRASDGRGATATRSVALVR